MSAPLNFHLAQYEGPLDLLLDLIRKQEINIRDIPIATITSQYLEYMEKVTALDIELSSDFVYMAATLIHIKSKMLLPRDPELDRIEGQEGDPRKELVDQLLEHERFKNAAEMLQQKRVIEEAVWSNPQIDQFISEDEGPGLAVTIFDLVQTFQTILERVKSRPLYEIGKETVSVPEMMQYLRQQLANLRKDSLSATQLFEKQGGPRAMICLFLAILELVRRQAVELTQGEAFGDIGLRRGAGFDEAEATVEDFSTVEREYH